MNEHICSYCNDNININKDIKPCLCDKYYHLDCWDIVEKNNNYIFYEKCLICKSIYHIDFKNKYSKYLYNLFRLYNLLFLQFTFIIYSINLILSIKYYTIVLLFISYFNLINWLLFLFTNLFIYKTISRKILVGLLFILITIFISYLDISFWFKLTLYIFNISLSRIGRTYIYLFSAKYHYIKIYNYARLN